MSPDQVWAMCKVPVLSSLRRGTLSTFSVMPSFSQTYLEQYNEMGNASVCGQIYLHPTLSISLDLMRPIDQQNAYAVEKIFHLPLAGLLITLPLDAVHALSASLYHSLGNRFGL